MGCQCALSLHQSVATPFKDALYKLGCDKEDENPTLAFSYFEKAAGQRHPDAQYKLGLCYETASGVTQNTAKAFFYFWLAANQNVTPAYYRLGKYFESGRFSSEPQTSIPPWMLQTLKIALYCYEIAAKNGMAEAQTHLAGLYWSGKADMTGPVIIKSPEKALYWDQQAANQGSPLSQYRLSNCYRAGIGVENDPDQAFQWCEKAAKNDHADAQFNIASFYYDGTGIGIDFEKSFFWYQKAANQMHPVATFMLGQCYEFSVGTAPNLNDAIKCYKLAMQLGYQQANAALTRCYKKLSPTQQPFSTHSSHPLMNTIQTLQNQQISTQVSRAPQGGKITQRNTMGPPVNTNATTTTVQQARQNPDRSSTPESMQPLSILKKIKAEPGVSQKSAKRRRPDTQTTVPSDLPKEPKLKKAKTEPTSIQRIKRVSSIDEGTLLKIAKKLRGTSRATNNCIRYVDALLRYFMTSEEPTAQVDGRPASLKYFHVTCYDHSVTVKSEVPQQRPEVRACEIPNGLQFGHTFHHATPQVSNIDNKPMIDLDKPYVIDLDAPTKLVKRHHDALNSYLMQQAEHAPGNFVFGYVGLPRCGQHLKEPGHGIAYYATPNKVFYIDCQPLLYNKKTNIWEGTPIFHHLAYDNKKKTGYHFVKGDNHKPGKNEFQPEVFTAPLWPVPGVHYTPHKERESGNLEFNINAQSTSL